MKPAIAAVLLGLIGESVVFSAVVSVAAGSSPPGGSIILPISFASEGSSVSAVQFDLKYDSSVMSLGITAGDIARTSGKSLYIADVSSNQKRFVLCGLNQAPIPDGVAVSLFVNLTTDATPGVYPLQLSNIVGATPAGEYAPVNGADGLVSVQAVRPRHTVVAGRRFECRDPPRRSDRTRRDHHIDGCRNWRNPGAG